MSHEKFTESLPEIERGLVLLYSTRNNLEIEGPRGCKKLQRYYLLGKVYSQPLSSPVSPPFFFCFGFYFDISYSCQNYSMKPLLIKTPFCTHQTTTSAYSASPSIQATARHSFRQLCHPISSPPSEPYYLWPSRLSLIPCHSLLLFLLS